MEKESNREKRIRPPIYGDWENHEVFTMFLKTFYEATKKFSASKYVIADIYIFMRLSK